MVEKEYIERNEILECYQMDDPVLNEVGHVPLPVIRQNIMDMPAADVVPRAAYEQAVWERDIAIQQLSDCGISFGGKADVAPVRHGRWIPVKLTRRTTEYKCSVCGRWERTNKEPYCNCGAKMDLEGENT